MPKSKPLVRSTKQPKKQPRKNVQPEHMDIDVQTLIPPSRTNPRRRAAKPLSNYVKHELRSESSDGGSDYNPFSDDEDGSLTALYLESLCPPSPSPPPIFKTFGRRQDPVARTVEHPVEHPVEPPPIESSAESPTQPQHNVQQNTTLLNKKLMNRLSSEKKKPEKFSKPKPQEMTSGVVREKGRQKMRIESLGIWFTLTHVPAPSPDQIRKPNLGKQRRMKAKGHDGSPYKKNQCNVCKKVQKNKTAYDLHMKQIHPKHKKICPRCGAKYKDFPHLLYHIWGHEGKAPYACQVDGCDFGFRWPRALEDHYRKHTQEKPYECEDCGEGFTMRSKFNAHSLKVHKKNMKGVRGVKNKKKKSKQKPTKMDVDKPIRRKKKRKRDE